MDNCFVHHMTEIIQMIEEVGSIVQFLPPYSPDFMPIELAFSKVKTSLKMDHFQKVDMETALFAAFAGITSED